MSNRKCSSTRWPCSVWSTSGWNCTPADRRARSSNAATSAPAERAVTVKPSGAADTESPWLIHTDGSAGRSRNRTDAGLGDLEPGAAELGQAGALDRAAHREGLGLEAVADAERGHAGAEQRRVDRRARPSAYTDEGPPDRITAAGRRARSSSTGIVCGTISL